MFTYYMRFLCSHIVVNIIELYTTVIQVSDLGEYKTRFTPPLSKEMHVHVPCQKYDSAFSFVWCVEPFDFCHLIKNVPFLNFLIIQYFVILLLTWLATYLRSHAHVTHTTFLHKILKLFIYYKYPIDE